MNEWEICIKYADVKANGCNATAIQFAMEFYHIYLSHTVVLAFILGKKLSSSDEFELKFPELSRAELGHFNFRADTELTISNRLGK